MKRIIILLAAFLALALATPLFSANYRVIYSFPGPHETAGTLNDRSLVVSGSWLYGVTSGGGAKGLGAVYALNKNGTGFHVIHSFSGSPTDGKQPCGELVVSAGWLYGTTLAGGSSDFGTVFKIKSDGTGYAVLHSFMGQDGTDIRGGLAVSGSWLYGTALYGGNTGRGAIFRIRTDGTGFALIHSFAGGSEDGEVPIGSPVVVRSTLYGLCVYGGAFTYGCIYRVNTDGTAYRLLHSFGRSSAEGALPTGSLLAAGTSLYGSTQYGGANHAGVLFRISTSGTGLTTLHSFGANALDLKGSGPSEAPAVAGSKLYGLLSMGGEYGRSGNGGGVLFQVLTTGGNFRVLHSFGGGNGDGANPIGLPALDGARLYGMAGNGGARGWGAIFCYDLPAADIAVSKTSENLAPAVGTTFNFTVTVTNKGPDSATGVKIKDLLPGRLSFVSASPSQGTYGPRTGIWMVGNLAKGAVATLTLRVRALVAGRAKNTAAVSALNEVDPVAANNSASVTITIQ